MISFAKFNHNLDYILVGIICLVVIVFLGRSLSPFNQSFFSIGHDETQGARVVEFANNLRHLQIPPRIAPQLNFNFGYPLFNFYAPAAYWMAGILYLVIPDIVIVLKIMFLLPIIVAYLALFLLLRKHFSLWPSFLGASLYVTSIYFGTDIFVRTNLAETWFLAFIPLSLLFLIINSSSGRKSVFVGTIFILSLTLTVHNILSLLWIPVLIIFLLLLPHKRKNLISLGIALLAASYFFIPLIGEAKLVYLRDIASKTDYHNHFLCPQQLWKSPWGYGGSNPGCENDGMSFMVGKPQIIVAMMGFLLGIWFFIVKPTNKTKQLFPFWLFFALTAIGSLVLTTYWSQFIWSLFSLVTSMIQFPWRLIAFSLVGLAFLSAFFWELCTFPFKRVVTVMIVLCSLWIDGKYFTQPTISASEYREKFIGQKQLLKKTVYQMPEYLSRTADYAVWKRYDTTIKGGIELPYAEYSTPFLTSGGITDINVIKNEPYKKVVQVVHPQTITVNVLTFPYWRYLIDDQVAQPTTIDALGRPQFTFTQPGTLVVYYQQTLLEMIGNIISLTTVACLGGYLMMGKKLITPRTT